MQLKGGLKHKGYWAQRKLKFVEDWNCVSTTALPNFDLTAFRIKESLVQHFRLEFILISCL